MRLVVGLHMEKNLWLRSASSMYKGEDKGHLAASGHGAGVQDNRVT
jgi:hypothetical protein